MYKLPFHHSASVQVRGGGNTNDIVNDSSHQRSVLILDVDNTLYQSSDHIDIEKQIVKNTHAFARKYFHLTPSQCDELYHSHGSTIEGLRDTLLKPETNERIQEVMKNFYEEVYNSIDYRSLLLTPQRASKGNAEAATGYEHESSSFLSSSSSLLELLSNLPSNIDLVIASNSPLLHVNRVLQCLGLTSVPNIKRILTPDTIVNSKNDECFPTKSLPSQYYSELLQKDSMDLAFRKAILIDDSKLNLAKAQQVGINGIFCTPDKSVEECIIEALQNIELENKNIGEGKKQKLVDVTSKKKELFEFDDVKYLESKNQMEANRFNQDVWERLHFELQTTINNNRQLTVVDVGAGILSMLPRIISIVEGNQNLVYYAYETNPKLRARSVQVLESMEFVETTANDTNDGELIFERTFGKSSNEGNIITIRLRSQNFVGDTTSDNHKKIDLIVGCCFADLFYHPSELIQSLLHFLLSNSSSRANNGNSSCLVYFPITFTGITQLNPPFPREINKSDRGKENNSVIPSDSEAFRMYGDCLAGPGMRHNIHPHLLLTAIQNFGGQFLTRGKSNWRISQDNHPYMWDCMKHFFRNSGMRQVMRRNNYNDIGWFERLEERKSNEIVVQNVDLLFRLGGNLLLDDSIDKSLMTNEKQRDKLYHDTKQECKKLMFVKERKTEVWNENRPAHLKPNQLEVKSICSLISSGTELKIFHNQFASDVQLDVNIKGMSESIMAYPLAYGYSLVGIVIRVGSDIDANQWIGKQVFTFAPHASHNIVNGIDSVRLIPNDIDPYDAIFFPSVETALSLVHDAHVRNGERVGVFGQGLIGLLVTRILQDAGCDSSVFDINLDRLGVSSMMGCGEALLAGTSTPNPFDATIEVSGNARGLQSAIDSTSSGGRIIIGSWYGDDKPVSLKLGIDFHRSQKTLITSQVSTIPSHLTGLWDKDRRFRLTWELLRKIKPSERLLTRITSIEDAQKAYETLTEGEEIAVAFEHNID